MGAIINNSQGSHWYGRDGSAQHKVPYAASNKAKAGMFKNTTLTDARKMNLLPSVTNVINILDKPNLKDWWIEQALIAADLNPRNPGEDLKDWMRRVDRASKVIVEEARSIGHGTHSLIEGYAKGEAITVPTELESTFNPLRDWFDKNVGQVHKTEFTVTADRYAGTLDLLADVRSSVTLIDFKTRGGGWTEDKHGNWKCATYVEDQIQLAAYRDAVCAATGQRFDDPIMATASVMVSSRSERPVYERQWTIDEMKRGLEIWNNILGTWCALKSYTPQP
jgi:hypothetical protein